MSRVTERDLALLGYVSRFGFVTQDQAARWFVECAGAGRSKSVVYSRLAVLREAGLIETRAVLAEWSRAIWVTREGLHTVGGVGAVHEPRLSHFEHDALVGDLALSVMIGKPHHELVTEREMRAADTTTQHHLVGESSSRPEWASGEGRQRRFPDLIQVAPTGRRVVHEVERTPKERRRLTRLMILHLSNPNVAAARYYTAPGAVTQRVTDAAVEARRVLADRGLDKPLKVMHIGEW